MNAYIQAIETALNDYIGDKVFINDHNLPFGENTTCYELTNKDRYVSIYINDDQDIVVECSSVHEVLYQNSWSQSNSSLKQAVTVVMVLVDVLGSGIQGDVEATYGGALH